MSNWWTEGVEAKKQAAELNKIAEPLDHVVTWGSAEQIDHPRMPGVEIEGARTWFAVRHKDEPPSHGRSFQTAAEAKAYLDKIKRGET